MKCGEALELCRVLKKHSIELRAAELAELIRKYGDYQYLKPSTKTRIFIFDMKVN